MSLDQGYLAQTKPNYFSLNNQQQVNVDSSHDQMGAPLVILCLALILVTLIVAATLWPGDSEDKLKRQRSYARVDDLYFPIQGIVITNELLEDLRGIAQAPENLNRHLDTFLSVDLRLTSLSLGGCAVKSEKQFEKGEMLILRLHLLPDFPNQNEAAVYRVTWTRPAKHPEKDARQSAGLQLLESFNDSDKSALKKYLNYLLDEPVA